LLLPECLDDYVDENNPVRVIEAFVGQLDLAALGFDRAAPADTGRPGYDPTAGGRRHAPGNRNSPADPRGFCVTRRGSVAESVRMSAASDDLPDDVAALRALVSTQAAEVAARRIRLASGRR
jgi:hypothetical protein